MRAGRRKPLTLSAAAVVLIVPAAVAAVGLSGPGWSAVAGRPSSTPFSSSVREAGSIAFADAYAGQTVSPSGVTTIYLAGTATGPFTDVVRRDAARHGGARYTFAHVRHSLAELNSLTGTISAHLADWRAGRIDITQWGPDAASNRVVVHLKHYTPAAAAAIEARYGTDRVTVSPAEVNNDDIRLLDRYHDHAPFSGGDAIFIGTPGVDCTLGWPMVGALHPDNHWFVTAGHCGDHTWMTGFTTIHTIGTTATNYIAHQTDVQTVGPASTSPAVWGNGTVKYVPSGLIGPQTGDRITFDGAKTGEVNRLRVTDPSVPCRDIEGIPLCGLAIAVVDSQTSGPVGCQGGDSGGPVFQRMSSGRGINAVGIVTAGTGDGKTCYYTDITAIEGIANVRVDLSGS